MCIFSKHSFDKTHISPAGFAYLSYTPLALPVAIQRAQAQVETVENHLKKVPDWS